MWWFTLSNLIVVVALLISCGAGDDQTIRGTLTLSDEDTLWSHGAPCSGSGGYDDIREGAQVVVKNEEGEVIATSSLQQGTGRDLLVALLEAADELEGKETPTSASGFEGLELVVCVLPFEVAVPNAAFYSVEVSHRGELSYSREELDEIDWSVDFELGN
ncbi:MAG: hypothetical protein IH860_03485 [Chloroflexi bacterium]|nr:hypothetical protein [Chloroflexota bacterium]